MPLFARFGAILRPDLVTAIVRFPVPVAAALVATVVLILGIAGLISTSELDRALFGTAAAFLAGVAGRIWLESRGRTIEIALSQAAALILGIGATLTLFAPWLDPEGLIAALVVLVVAAPSLAKGGTPVRFWAFNIRSALVGKVGVVGVGAFVLGFVAILGTLQSLFDLRISDRPYGYAAAVGFALVLPLYWLAYQPRVLEIADEEPQPDIFLRIIAGLTDFVAIPLLAAYALILHAYAAKIAIDAALPRGQIGWMVSVFLALGYLTFLLALPRQSPLSGLRRLFRLLWPLATIVPVVLLALAFSARVKAYGITEERYLIATIALWATLLFIAWLPRRRLDARLVPAVAAGLLLIAAVGPLSARSMTARSQAQRFVAILQTAGMLKDGRLDGERSAAWEKQTRYDLHFIINLLEKRGSLYLLAPVVGEELAADRQKLIIRLDLNRSEPIRQKVLEYVRIDNALLTNEFSWWLGETIIFRAPGDAEYALKVEDRQAVFSGPDGTFVFDLSAMPEMIEFGSHPRVIKADNPRAALTVRRLGWRGSGKARTINRLQGAILIRTAPEPQ